MRTIRDSLMGHPESSNSILQQSQTIICIIRHSTYHIDLLLFWHIFLSSFWWTVERHLLRPIYHIPLTSVYLVSGLSFSSRLQLWMCGKGLIWSRGVAYSEEKTLRVVPSGSQQHRLCSLQAEAMWALPRSLNSRWSRSGRTEVPVCLQGWW
jgi:hypothetical protein